MAEAHTLYRSRRDRIVAGVCGGIGEYFGLDPTVVRLIAVVVTVFGNAAAIVAYVVMWIVVPEEPASDRDAAAVPPPAVPDRGAVIDAPGTPQPPISATGSPPMVPAARPAARGTGLAWVGAALVAVGIALLVDVLAPSLDIWSFWPLTVAGLVVIALGVRMILSSAGEK